MIIIVLQNCSALVVVKARAQYNVLVVHITLVTSKCTARVVVVLHLVHQSVQHDYNLIVINFFFFFFFLFSRSDHKYSVVNRSMIDIIIISALQYYTDCITAHLMLKCTTQIVIDYIQCNKGVDIVTTSEYASLQLNCNPFFFSFFFFLFLFFGFIVTNKIN